MEPRELTVGILAHVDAGKTTLTESILTCVGLLKRAGRVDHGDAFLDTYDVEKARGITVFSKPAVFPLGGRTVTLLDTPGHADFSPEMERTLWVLDGAVLLVSAAEGVNERVRILWRLLARHDLPVLIFVNKMDQPGSDRPRLLREISEKLSDCAVDMTSEPTGERAEELAVLDEALMERYLEDGVPPGDGEIRGLFARRSFFPVVFGAALRQEGVARLLELLDRFGRPKGLSESFGARVFKIARDEEGKRLTWLKLTGGRLAIRDEIAYAGFSRDSAPEEDGEEAPAQFVEKITGIRRYSGMKCENLQEIGAGAVCAVTGLTATYIGQGLGTERGGEEPLLLPVVRRRLILPEGTDPYHVYSQLRSLEEEEPMLQLSYEEQTREIFLGLMGEVQTEVLSGEIGRRLGMEVSFGEGTIIYKETIADVVEGVGHFEPLRHYAEVHVLLAPLPPGSGIVVDADCRTDVLKENWQRLAVSDLMHKRHKGVLTGSDLTDVQITLIGGRAHEKHTEGGDFRKASIRAVRQGLMSAESVLLEPLCRFVLEVPRTQLGLALTDLETMCAHPEAPLFLEDGERARVTGTCPVSTWGDYALRVRAYTGGRGTASAYPAGYQPCHNAEEVIAACAYDPESDLGNPSSSVFCSHGAGVIVPWDQVRERMHVDTGWRPGAARQPDPEPLRSLTPREIRAREDRAQATEEELLAIFERTYGKIRRASSEEDAPRRRSYDPPKVRYRAPKPPSDRQYLLIDGYNMIHANRELKLLAETDIHAARDALIRTVANAQGFLTERMILVFDAYKVPGGKEHVLEIDGLTVIYTREAETADQYIERAAHEIGKRYRVRVATSDGIEQIIIFGAGALRLSAAGFWEEMELASRRIREAIDGS